MEGIRQGITGKIKAEQVEVMELEESRPRGLFAILKDTSTRDENIKEHKKNIESFKKSLSDIDERLAKIQRLRDYHTLLKKYSAGDRKLTPLDADFMKMYVSKNEKESTKAQVTNPWFTAQYNREREKLFLYACKLHKEFVTASKCMRHNIINLMIAWNMFDECGERMKPADRKAAMPSMLQSIWNVSRRRRKRMGRMSAGGT